MRIAAKEIARWAESLDARASLPRLVRRLALSCGTITQIAFPAGESIGLPEWDGEILSTDGDPWVPKGRSCWEVSCEVRPSRKAERDYVKRTENTPWEVRREATLAVVTARRWGKGKRVWEKAKNELAEWWAVRAYDADDLELWLESNTAIGLDFAEELGLLGEGVESIGRYWHTWACQSDPPIHMEPFFADREAAKDRLLVGLRQRIGGSAPLPFAIRADSVEEATAFVCAALSDAPDLADAALVVTAETGWRFVEKHPDLKIAVATRPEIAARPATGAPVVVVVPVAAGDPAAGFGGEGARGFDLRLERPGIYAFRDALIESGIEKSDAQRLALATGRSWTVLRRRRAANPAIRSPHWLTLPESDALSTLCLLGAWSGASAADHQAVEHITGCTYEVAERKLRVLAQVDDPPVLQIGKVWHAKSPLELLDLYAGRLTSGELDRFFETVEALLVQPDPQLELPPHKRWMAQVYGKARAESGLLLQSVCDTLVKLAVRGPEYPSLATLSIDARVASLVRRLLNGADDTRWLSLASHLRPLAEAAPETFLKAVESSLISPGAPVTRLFSDSVASGESGHCWWYADLLWALGILAWSPRWVVRVVPILGQLAQIVLPENWGNSPINSLLDIFRSWKPNTRASVAQRVVALDRLIREQPDVAFRLVKRLADTRFDIANSQPGPTWRDDDAGVDDRAPQAEYEEMLEAAGDRLVSMAQSRADRLVEAVEILDELSPDQVERLLSHIAAFVGDGSDDEDKEHLRDALRERIWWHLNFGDRDSSVLAERIGPWQALYDRLSPADPVIRDRWLFNNDWVNLPIDSRDDYELERGLREQWQQTALDEIYRTLGMAGVVRLATRCGAPFLVGRCLIPTVAQPAELVGWIASEGGDFAIGSPLTSLIGGIVRFLEKESSSEIIRTVSALGLDEGWPAERIAAFLRLALDGQATWDIVSDCGVAVENAYWKTVTPNLIPLGHDERDYCLRKLLAADRPRTALAICRWDYTKTDPGLLADALDTMLEGVESDAPLPVSHSLIKLFERLESWEGMDRNRLIRMQFHLIPALQFDARPHLKALHQAIASSPEIFAELISLAYWPDHGEHLRDTLTEAEDAAAECARIALDNCRRQPGTAPDGSIDADAGLRFVEEVRKLCRKQDRSAICDWALGQIFAHTSAGDDGIWPGQPARDILNGPEMDQMRDGFAIGAYNKRGMTVRAPDAGGDQERTLAQQYRRNATALESTHPYLAEILEARARSYEADGRRHDDAAGLQREHY